MKHITHCYTTRNKPELLSIKEKLETQLAEVNTFFDEYLEVFSEEMNMMDRKSSVWRAYNDMFAVWETVKTNLKMTNHYLGML